MIVAVIPARAGSERVPEKNTRDVGGRPLLSYTLDTACAVDSIDVVAVSTDSSKAVALATDKGVRVVERPGHLATAEASTEGVLLHVLDELEADGLQATWVVTLPPTSPFRRSETVEHFVAAATGGPASVDCYFSVHENRGDFWLQTDDGNYRRLFPDAPRRQQARTPLLEENSAIYVTRVAALRSSGSILGLKSVAMTIDPLEGFDLNTELDFSMAEALLSNLA